MNFFLNQKSKTEPKNLVQISFFFLESGLYQIYKEKSIFFLAAPVTETVNQNLIASRKWPKE